MRVRTRSAFPAGPGTMPAFPARLACNSGRSRSFPDRPVTTGKALLMRLGGNTLRGSNPRSSALTSSFARALRPGGLLVSAFRGLCVATAAIRPPIYLVATRVAARALPCPESGPTRATGRLGSLASVTERHPQMHAHAVMGGRHRTTKRFVVSAPGAWFWPRARTLIAERGQPSGGNRARSRLIETSGRRCGPGRDGSEPGRSVERSRLAWLSNRLPPCRAGFRTTCWLAGASPWRGSKEA